MKMKLTKRIAGNVPADILENLEYIEEEAP